MSEETVVGLEPSPEAGALFAAFDRELPALLKWRREHGLAGEAQGWALVAEGARPTLWDTCGDATQAGELLYGDRHFAVGPVREPGPHGPVGVVVRCCG